MSYLSGKIRVWVVALSAAVVLLAGGALPLNIMSGSLGYLGRLAGFEVATVGASCAPTGCCCLALGVACSCADHGGGGSVGGSGSGSESGIDLFGVPDDGDGVVGVRRARSLDCSQAAQMLLAVGLAGVPIGEPVAIRFDERVTVLRLATVSLPDSRSLLADIPPPKRVG